MRHCIETSTDRRASLQLRIAWLRATSVSAFSTPVPGQRLTIAQALHGLYPLLVPSWAASKVDALQHLASRPGITHMCLRSLMQGIRRSMNLPDWEIVVPESNPNPFFDTLAPSVAPGVRSRTLGPPALAHAPPRRRAAGVLALAPRLRGPRDGRVGLPAL